MSAAKFSASRLLDSADSRPETSRLLLVYLRYRLGLAVALSLALLLPQQMLLGQTAPSVHEISVIVYLLLCLLSLTINQWGQLAPDVEYSLAIFVDAMLASSLTYTAGGPNSGHGILFGVSIAIAGLGMSGRIALFAAAMGTLAMFGETLYSYFSGIRPEMPLSRVSLLGMAYFALALLAHKLSSRARASEELAMKRGLDIANLTQINEYVIQHIQTGIIVLDGQHQVRMLNDAAWTLLGTPDVAIGHQLQDINMPLYKAFYTWRETPSARIHHIHTVPHGDNLQAFFSIIGAEDNRGTLIFLEDASKAAETAQQIKLASLGRLTASIAHEIRNPLGAISHASQLLEEAPELHPADKRMIEIIKNNSARLNEVIENILALSRRHAPNPESIELKPYLERMSKEAVAANQLRADQVSLHVDQDCDRVVADRQQLSQILVALMDNSVCHFPAHRSNLHMNIAASVEENGRTKVIEIIDNGTGIAADIAPKIFDPFFTTRNDGTGLGLYVVKELCDLNNIRISYLPVTGGGSCFRLRFQNTEMPMSLSTKTMP